MNDLKELIYCPPMKKTLMRLASDYPELAGEDGLPPVAGELECCGIGQGSRSPWKAEWRILALEQRHAELTVSAGGNGYHLIVGRYSDGHYLCSPDWKIGVPLAGLTDILWNYEQLSGVLGPFDAASIVRALADCSRKTGWGR